MFDLAAYLQRIGLSDASANAAGLSALQQAQLRVVPFENLDPLRGIVPALGVEEIFAKTISGRRGGYCFELNTLFGTALEAVGFRVRRTLARVRMRTGAEGARSHLVLLVEAGERRFLADSGFGGPGSLIPLDLDEKGIQQAPNGTYRLVEDVERGETVLERRKSGGWDALYAFDGARVSDGDIAYANYTCATWGNAPFPSHAMLGCYRGDTRYGLFDRLLTIETAEGAQRREIAHFDEFATLVTDTMEIGLDRTELRRAWDRIDFDPSAVSG